MHKSRSNRKANQERRDRQARRQSPLPLAVQQDWAEERLKSRHAQYDRQGPEYAHPSYGNTVKGRPARIAGSIGDNILDLSFFEITLRNMRRMIAANLRRKAG